MNDSRHPAGGRLRQMLGVASQAVTSERIELFSDYPPAECASRIAEVIDTERVISFGSLFGSKPVVGRVTESSLNLRKRIAYRNSFQSIFTATMRPAGSGTLIAGECGIHPFVMVFMCLWFGGVIFIGGTLFVSALFAVHPLEDNNWIGIVVPPGMLLFGFLLFHFGRYLARKEAQFLKSFVAEALNAHDNTRNA